MSFWKDITQQEVSQKHRKEVMGAVKAELAALRNRNDSTVLEIERQRLGFFKELWSKLSDSPSVLVPVGGIAAAVAAVLVLRPQSPKNQPGLEDMDVLAMDPTVLKDMDLLANLDTLELLDVLQEWDGT